MSRGIKVLLVVMIIIDVCTFLPSIIGWAGAAFLWDDPHVKAASWTGLLRLFLTFLLMGAPFYIGINFLLACKSLRGHRQINAVTWASFFPPLLILGSIIYLVMDDARDRMQTHRVERSYEEIVAAPGMERFHALTKDLSPYVRLPLAERAQHRLKEHGITPPATVDELYADEYRVMLGQKEALKRGRITKSEYDLQHGLESEYQLEIGAILPKPQTFPERKLFDVSR